MKIQKILQSLFLILFAASPAPAAVRYVDAGGASPTPPFTGWGTAATNIQDAVDAAADGDLILVTNGVYATGGRAVYGALTNRVAVDRAVTVQSVNGPEVTIILGYRVPGTTNGDSAVRCAYLTNGAVLAGFTLTNGATRTGGDPWTERTGGGVWCESTNAVLSNCVLIANAAITPLDGVGGGAFFGTLHGCTLTGNEAAAGGATYSSILNDCLVAGNKALRTQGGGSFLGTLNNCILSGNSAPSGGGASSCTLNNCTITTNLATGYGGGAGSSTLNNCVLTGNTSGSGGGGAGSSLLNGCTLLWNSGGNRGGGAYSSTLNDCTVRSNSASDGGGIHGGMATNCLVAGNRAGSGGGANLGTLQNCVLSGNTADQRGGGAISNTLINCALINNSAHYGGGARGSTLLGCTVAGNSADYAGGVDFCLMTNCVVYHNLAATDANCSASNSLSFCCTTPLPSSGTGNIAADPQLADSFHLSAGSPCRAAGSAAWTVGADIDGEPWASPPAIGCDEFQPGSATGSLSVAIQTAHTNLAAGFVADFTAFINGHASSNYWDLGDGTRLTNRPSVTRAWPADGVYTVRCHVFNIDQPAGVSAELEVHVQTQPVQYVALSNATPVAPYLSWPTAAANIQDAVDAGFAGGTILVSNGVYRTGGRVVQGALTNRVVVDKPVTVQSVNGPEVTVIEGYQVPGVINSNQAVRCVYLADGASLAGFTLTNGATDNAGYTLTNQCSGGGIFCESTKAAVSNCVMVANASFLYGGGACFGTLRNCRFDANTAITYGGGGAAFGVLTDCTLTGNRAAVYYGGGAFSCVLSNCELSANVNIGAKDCLLDHCVVTGNSGNGLYLGTANHCTISSNTVLSSNPNGGGAYQATLNDCILYGNRATNGGGAYDCVLNGCVLSNNTAVLVGGGACSSVLAPGNNNVFAGNSAGRDGGGFYSAAKITQVLTNWTFIGNTSGGSGGGLNAAFLPTLGLAGCAFSSNSAAGSGGGFYAIGSTTAICTNCTFNGNIAGGDGGGAYNVELAHCSLIGNQAGNGGGAYGKNVNDCVVAGNHAATNGGGILVLLATKICDNNAFTNNSAGKGGAIYCPQGATFSNCVFVGNSAVTNGGGFGGAEGQFKRCQFLGNQAALGGGGYGGTYAGCLITSNSASLDGGGIYILGTATSLSDCTLSFNSAAHAGGGIFGGRLTNCVLNGNQAMGHGGGAGGSLLFRCVLSNNRADSNGGGAYNSSLFNCLLTGNSASYGGGMHGSSANTVNNNTIIGNLATNAGGGVYFTSAATMTGNIVYYNTATSNLNHYGAVYSGYCCTTPLPSLGAGTITNEPAFVDLAGGNLRLQTSSPCINTGTGTGSPGTNDLDGRPRIVGGTIDIGAYEYQGAGMGEFIAWLQYYGLPVNGAADYTDPDLDRLNDWQEWRAGTVPTNALSTLKMLSASKGSPGVTVSWQSVGSATYFVERSTNLTAQPAFSAIQSNLTGQVDTTSFTDTSATGSGPFYYRVAVQ